MVKYTLGKYTLVEVEKKLPMVSTSLVTVTTSLTMVSTSLAMVSTSLVTVATRDWKSESVTDWLRGVGSRDTCVSKKCLKFVVSFVQNCHHTWTLDLFVEVHQPWTEENSVIYQAVLSCQIFHHGGKRTDAQLLPEHEQCSKTKSDSQPNLKLKSSFITLLWDSVPVVMFMIRKAHKTWNKLAKKFWGIRKRE